MLILTEAETVQHLVVDTQQLKNHHFPSQMQGKILRHSQYSLKEISFLTQIQQSVKRCVGHQEFLKEQPADKT